MHGTVEASKLRKGKCAYNPWTHISHKELIYLLQKFSSPRSKVLLRMLLGEGLVGVNHRAIPTATQRKTINKYFMLRLRYIMVHHTCMLRESQTPTNVFFNSTITQLAQLWYYHLYISKQSIKHPTSLSILKFITKVNYHAVLKDSQNDISEAWEINYFYKIEPPPCSKRYKRSTRAKTIWLKYISEAHRVF